MILENMKDEIYKKKKKNPAARSKPLKSPLNVQRL